MVCWGWWLGGRGDTILVQQLQERPYWGLRPAARQEDPNLRLAQFVAAAQRGATVRLLLDDFFDERGQRRKQCRNMQPW